MRKGIPDRRHAISAPPGPVDKYCGPLSTLNRMVQCDFAAARVIRQDFQRKQNSAICILRVAECYGGAPHVALPLASRFRRGCIRVADLEPGQLSNRACFVSPEGGMALSRQARFLNGQIVQTGKKRACAT